jgi:23S rRNA (cytidine1920-2'-O)/16S rRNA (cytidine1409-2'-O)-methyltransferase
VSPPGRLDLLLGARGLAATRSKAQELIRRGHVKVNGSVLQRPGALVEPDAALEVSGAGGFVSRGGDKLEGALEVLGAGVEGAVVVDIGASTGGFTDCVLRRGARKVYAIDVGHGQLHPTLRADPRVVSREGTNARDLVATDFDEPVDLVLVDASFIAIHKLLPAVARILPPRGRLMALVKPQFEVGKAIARQTRGVVRDPGQREPAIAEATRAVVACGFTLLGECDSALAGPRGNVEHFVYAERGA